MSTRITDQGWQVEDIDQGGIIDRSMITILFPENGKVGGSSGCNPCFGAVSIEGESISFSKMGSGRKACAEALMRQEARFFAAMNDAVTFDIQDDSILILTDAAGQIRIRAISFDPEVATRQTPLDLPSETHHEFDCGDAGTATMRFLGPETIELNFVGETHILVRERSASGAKYATEGISFWNKGDEALLEVEGERVSCTRVQ